ncbi:Protein CBG24544 [Caenorhabditis briggsae]|uniref:Protein CBG24544 n=1 Tax=Caenorhabditis briggsae TaxID=6238 RepID=A8WKY3_CAEBR|nr:Protein CBG24544 [Caenorhabditis briggsae]CAP21128.2 Protein CBG24544 [Caenorhabditis briggsae]
MNRRSPRFSVPESGRKDEENAEEADSVARRTRSQAAIRQAGEPSNQEAGCGEGTVDAQVVGGSETTADDQEAVDSGTVDAQDVNLLGATEVMHPTAERPATTAAATYLKEKKEEKEKKKKEAVMAAERHRRKMARKLPKGFQVKLRS